MNFEDISKCARLPVPPLARVATSELSLARIEKTRSSKLQCPCATTPAIFPHFSFIKVNISSNRRPGKMHFLDNFDPVTSERERRKQNRKNYFGNRKSKSIYNERGEIAASGKDVCDCLDEKCPGCHFPCPKCNSCKCGHECRVNRKWMYDRIEIEGNDAIIKNEYKHK